MGSTTCEGSVWLSTSAVFCRAAHGVGSFLAIVLTVDKAIQQLSVVTSLSLAFTYHAPTIIGSNPVNFQPSRDSPLHSSMATLIGHSFGAVSDVSIRAKVGRTACEAAMWISDSAIWALVASGTSAVALPASVSVATRYLSSWVDQDNRRFYDMVRHEPSAQTVTSLISYDAPHLRSDVRNATYHHGKRFLGASSLNAPTSRSDTAGDSSGILIDVIGTSLAGADLTMRVKMGLTTCERSQWRSSTGVSNVCRTCV